MGEFSKSDDQKLKASYNSGYMTGQGKLPIFRHFRPIHLGTSLILYFLGAGYVRYLGQQLDYSGLWLGLAWMICIQLGFYFLGDYFNSPFDTGLYSYQENKTNPNENGSPGKASPLLYGSVSFLAAAAVLIVILTVLEKLSAASVLVMLLYFLLYLLLVVPGFSLDQSGLGEIISSITLVVIPPALAFILQAGGFHSLLPLGVFPLFPLNLALILVLRLKRYRDDLSRQRKTLLVRLGWVQGVFIHNLLLFSGFFLFGISLLFGMPVRIVGPVFTAMPVGIYLIWYLSSLEDGAPVRWQVITLLSLVVFFLPVYLVTYSVWIR